MFARWGTPDEIISEKGSQFVSSDSDQFFSQLGIQHNKTALYGPQANGVIERFNRVVKEGIRAFQAEGLTYDEALRSIISNYSSTTHSTTGVTPSVLMICRRFKMPSD